METKNKEIYIRNIIFGVEDSLVSTVGLISGVAVAGVGRSTILLTGIVLLMVEAFSMGVGSLLTEHSVQQYERKRDVPFGRSVGGSVTMLFSYLIAGLVPLLPYALVASETAFMLSIGWTLVALFALGAISARYFGINIWKNGLEMLILGGVAIALGVVVGRFIHIPLA